MTTTFLLRLAVTATMLAATAVATAQRPQYQAEDSILVEKLLVEGASQPKQTNLMVFFGKKLCGTPYVAKTLERNNTERLVINLRELDCTTFVENVLALTLCTENGKTDFRDFYRYLRNIRYRKGHVTYPDRLHYFTEWIEDNTAQGFVHEVQGPNPPFTAVQTVNVNYMTTNTSQYPMLKGNRDFIRRIASNERNISKRRYRYIPKSSIANNRLFRNTIHDGDIIAILTSRKGLDTSHIGIAVWLDDGLHLLNASRLHGKVVLEPKLLRTYMAGQRMQTGIRIIRKNQGVLH